MAHFSSHETPIKGTHLELGLIGGLSISQALMISTLATLVRKHIGARWTMCLGSILIFLSLLTSSFATQVWHLFLSQGLCFGWGMGFAYVTAASTLPPWFSTRRSLAYGLATSGAGIGGLVYSVATNAIIQSLGWEWAYRILAFCALGANMTSSALLKEFGHRQRVADELKFNMGAFRRVEVLLIVAWGAATELGYIILLYSLPTYASSIGLTASQGAISSALLNLGLALARPLVGYTSDTYGRINMAWILTGLCTIFCFGLWIPASNFASLVAFSLISGALCGTFWCTVTPVVAEVVGIRELASTFGAICIFLVVPTTFAEAVAMALVRDSSGGSFINAQIFVGFMFLLGTVSLWFLRSWKVFDIEQLENREESHGGADARITVEGSSSSSRLNKYGVRWLTPRLLFSSGRV